MLNDFQKNKNAPQHDAAVLLFCEMQKTFSRG